MQAQDDAPVLFISITDVVAKAHVDTVFFSSPLELQLNEGKLREKYKDDRFVIATHPSQEQVRSSEITDIYYQARMQSLLRYGLSGSRSM